VPTDTRPAPDVTYLDRAVSGGNSLGLVRLLLAALVIVGHAYELGGFGRDPLARSTGVAASSLAVLAFFCISGYLITRSARRTAIVPYLWRRVLRIFPGFLAVLVVTAFVVGPLLWWVGRGTLAGYLTLEADGPVRYVLANADLGIDQQGIHGLLTGTPWGLHTGASVFNGSLWTLEYEWRCYLLVGALAVVGILRRARWAVLVLTLVLQVLLALRVLGTGWADAGLGLVPGWEDSREFWATLRFTTSFLMGACLALYAHRVRLDDRIGWACALVLAVSVPTGLIFVVGTPALAYVLLWGAVRLPSRLRVVGEKADYSYGVYVYGFLVQQVLARAGVHEAGLVVYTLAALVLVAPCAWLSWHLVEGPAMGLKDRGPGRWSADSWRRGREASRRARGDGAPVALEPVHQDGPDGLPEPATARSTST
jgi:peptidoglycan/LPS O-acetylase OafA/YrhL